MADEVLRERRGQRGDPHHQPARGPQRHQRRREPGHVRPSWTSWPRTPTAGWSSSPGAATRRSAPAWTSRPSAAARAATSWGRAAASAGSPSATSPSRSSPRSTAPPWPAASRSCSRATSWWRPSTPPSASPRPSAGLIAGAGGLIRMPKRLPMAVALELAMTGDAIDAERAYALGLVNKVVPADALLAEAVALAERIAANAPLAVRYSKSVMKQRRRGARGGGLGHQRRGGRASCSPRPTPWRAPSPSPRSARRTGRASSARVLGLRRSTPSA